MNVSDLNQMVVSEMVSSALSSFGDKEEIREKLEGVMKMVDKFPDDTCITLTKIVDKDGNTSLLALISDDTAIDFKTEPAQINLTEIMEEI